MEAGEVVDDRLQFLEHERERLLEENKRYLKMILDRDGEILKLTKSVKLLRKALVEKEVI